MVSALGIFHDANARNVTVLYSFEGLSDGGNSTASLISDKKGNLYGTTVYGGQNQSAKCGELGCGTVFRLGRDGTETAVYQFAGGGDGRWPLAALIMGKDGDLYGTTYIGGGTGCDSHSGCGTVFKLSPSGTETVLYRFMGGADGGNHRDGGFDAGSDGGY